MISGGRVLLAALLACACSRPAEKAETPAPRDSAMLAPTSTTTAKSTKGGKAGAGGKPGAKPVHGAKPAATQSAAVSVDAGEPPKIVEQDELKIEEPEANPYSETVTLKLNVTPQVKAVVQWGAKVVARLEPGKMEAEITRPRGSGPVDLDIKAEGYLPYHTRLYADRNDKLLVRLYRPEEAPNLFGYKRSAEAKKAEAEKQR